MDKVIYIIMDKVGQWERKASLKIQWEIIFVRRLVDYKNLSIFLILFSIFSIMDCFVDIKKSWDQRFVLGKLVKFKINEVFHAVKSLVELCFWNWNLLNGLQQGKYTASML